MRKLLPNIALACTSVFLFLLVLEGFTRITGLATTDRRPPPIYQVSQNPLISYELKPSIQEEAFKAVVTTNSRGFRSPELIPGTPLVVLLGDSITFGYGVQDDQTLAAALQRHHPQYQFLNTGVPGYNLLQERALYMEKIVDLDPTAVLLVFYPNDLTFDTGKLDAEGILRSESWQPGDADCRAIESGVLRFLPGQCWLAEHSAFFVGFKKVLDLRASKRNVDANRGDLPSPQAQDTEAAAMVRYTDALRALSVNLPRKRFLVIWPDHMPHPAIEDRLIPSATGMGFTVINLYETLGTSARTLDWDTSHPHPDTIETAAGIISESLGNAL